jgi:hypothetical protein
MGEVASADLNLLVKCIAVGHDPSYRRAPHDGCENRIRPIAASTTLPI